MFLSPRGRVVCVVVVVVVFCGEASPRALLLHSLAETIHTVNGAICINSNVLVEHMRFLWWRIVAFWFRVGQRCAGRPTVHQLLRGPVAMDHDSGNENRLDECYIYFASPAARGQNLSTRDGPSMLNARPSGIDAEFR